MLAELGDGSDLSHVQETKDSRGYTAEITRPEGRGFTREKMRNIEMQLGQSFRDYVNTLLWEYSKEVYSTETPDRITLEELIDSHREIRKARIENRETYREGYSTGYEDAKSRYSMDNRIELSELRDMTIDELIEFLKNKEGE